MSPLNLHNEVLIHLFGTKLTDWPARTDQHSILPCPRGLRSVGADPAGQVTPVEHWFQVVSRRDRDECQQEGSAQERSGQ